MTDQNTDPQNDQIEKFPQSLVNNNPKKSYPFAEIMGMAWDGLLRIGLGEITMKAGAGILFFALLLMVVWVMGKYYLPEQTLNQAGVAQAASLADATVVVPEINNDAYVSENHTGITRISDMHTIIPERPRYDVIEYEVQAGDTIFGIAEKFNLDPETILWGNQYILADDPHNLVPEQTLNILPVNGVYYDWHAGDGLNGVAEYFGVTIDDILTYEGNRLSEETIGDYAFPNIEVGTWLIIPGGTREFISWSAPRITRDDPAVAKIFGSGYCGEVYDGPIGTGTFLWPAVERYLSGFDWSPETNHFGIDVAGDFGHAIFAADSGVVVYAGWNDWGYGNVVVIDHGNGWQTLYAHLDSYKVACGTNVYQSQIIALMGSTGNSSGPHLHFELRSDEYGKVNPWNFLN
ncbi:MAG: M23 family metallopeptidase [Anaerolineaceae bacterium]|nr:M23 family metallopeptidase [Anaerolineaceae bacterium]